MRILKKFDQVKQPKRGASDTHGNVERHERVCAPHLFELVFGTRAPAYLPASQKRKQKPQKRRDKGDVHGQKKPYDPRKKKAVRQKKQRHNQ